MAHYGLEFEYAIKLVLMLWIDGYLRCRYFVGCKRELVVFSVFITNFSDLYVVL